MGYLWFKAFHLIGVVVWFAGLFYLVRLFVYHAEALKSTEPARKILSEQYALMESRLLHIITTPGMVLTVVMALGMLYLNPGLLKQGWMHFKLLLVVLLIVYHVSCMRIRKQFLNGTMDWGGQRFRYFNEAPTLILVLVVMLAVFKAAFPVDGGTWVVVGLTLSMLITIQLYAKKRKRQAAKSD